MRSSSMVVLACALVGSALRDGRLLSSGSMQFMTAWFPAGDWGQVGHNLFRVEPATGPAVIGHDGNVLDQWSADYIDSPPTLRPPLQ